MKKVLIITLTLACLLGISLSLFSSQALASNPDCTDDLCIGSIDTPPGVAEYQAAAEAETGAEIGIIYFISNLIKIFAVVAGIWTLFNVIMAGYIYVGGSGDAGAHQKVQTQITNSVIGLFLIVLAFTFGGLIGLIFFGDASFILRPQLPTP